MKVWSEFVIIVGVILFVIGLVENILLIPSSVLIAGGTIARSISCLRNDIADGVGTKSKEPN